jgi:hypothetical protein
MPWKFIDGGIAFRPAERREERGHHVQWSLDTSALMDGYVGLATPRGTVLDASLGKLDWEWRVGSGVSA